MSFSTWRFDSLSSTTRIVPGGCILPKLAICPRAAQQSPLARRPSSFTWIFARFRFVGHRAEEDIIDGRCRIAAEAERAGPGLSGELDSGTDQALGLQGQVGRAVLPPGGLHAGLHDGAFGVRPPG